MRQWRRRFVMSLSKSFILNEPSDYFLDYAKRYTDLPVLVMLEGEDGARRAGRYLRASRLKVDDLGQRKQS